jgi:serine/threonine protein kinase
VPARAGDEIRVLGYKVLSKIGEGGMSSVFLADDEAHGRKAVLKILKVRRKEDEELWQRFFQECAILSSIDNEHVVRIYDQGFGDEMAYIAMEYLGGGSLREVIDKGLSRRQALSLLSQAASGLAAIHSRGIVHRDIKPANLMLRTEGVLVLTDFGVAKRLEHTNGHTIQGEVLGTPHYISPEQAQAGEVGPSADLYSLGVIFYEMLTGKRAFTGETILEVLSQHIIAPIPRLPAELEDYQPLIDGLLAKRAQDRFPDADALLAEIDRIWTSQSIQKKLGVSSS